MLEGAVWDAWDEATETIQTRFPTYPNCVGLTLHDFKWMVFEQERIFHKHKVRGHSLSAQLKRVFDAHFLNLDELHRKPRICFIDFDDTICHNEYDSKGDLLVAHYNRVPGVRWRAILEQLSQTFVLVLLTNRIPLLGEKDGLLNWMIDGIPFPGMMSSEPSLSGLFACKILTSRLAPKGFVLEYIREIISAKKHFQPHQFVLVDDDDANLSSSMQFGFRVIRASYGTGPGFILELERLSRETGELESFHVVSPTSMHPPHEFPLPGKPVLAPLPASPVKPMSPVKASPPEEYFVLSEETLKAFSRGEKPPEHLRAAPPIP